MTWARRFLDALRPATRRGAHTEAVHAPGAVLEPGAAPASGAARVSGAKRWRWNVRRAVSAAALVAAGAIVVAHGARDRARGGGSWASENGDDPPQEARVDAAGDDAVRHAVWRVTKDVPRALCTAVDEHRPTVSPDGRYLAFAAGRRGENVDLWISDLAPASDGSVVAGEPRLVAELDTPHDESAPAFAGDALYFASDRPGGAGGLDLYRATFADGRCGAPERLDERVQSPRDDTDPCVGAGELVFASDRAGDFDLYACALAPHAPHELLEGTRVEHLASLASPRDEREPAFDRDARFLYFASARADSFDVFRAVRRTRTGEHPRYDAPAEVVELTTPADERGPWLAGAGHELWFARATGDRGLDLARAESIELVRVPHLAWSWAELTTIAALIGLALLALLVERRPSLGPMWWCYLVSLLVHLILLWWFRDVFLAGGDAGPRERGRRIRVSVDAGELSARRVERAGRVTTPAESARVSAPERVEFAQLAPDAVEHPRPARASAASDPLATSAPASPRRPAASAEVAPFTRADAAPRGLQDREVRPRTTPGAQHEPELVASSTAGARAPAASAPAPARVVADAAAVDPVARIAARADPAAHAVHLPTPEVGRSPGMSPSASGVARDQDTGTQLVLADREPRARHAGETTALGDREAFGTPTAIDVEQVTGTGASPLARADAGSAADAQVTDAPPAARWEAASPTLSSVEPGPRTRAEAPHDERARASPSLRDLEPRRPRASGSPSGSDALPDAVADPALAAVDLGASAAPRAAAAPRLDLGPSDLEPTRPERAPASRLDVPMPAPDAPPVADARTPWQGTPYQNRTGAARERALRDHGGDQATEAAVERGLAYLARIQGPEGAWGDLRTRDAKYGRVAVGKTALATLAFLGAGHTHRSGTQHSAVVARALAFLLDQVDERTGHVGDTDAYGHGIATYALAEAYALTHDADLRPALERAVARIVSAQSRARDESRPRAAFEARAGGWSYFYPDGHEFDRWSRTSITSWMVMALESARLSGVDVPEETFTAAARFLEGGWDEELGAWRYDHDPDRLESGYPTLPASTPAALFALSITGTDVTAERFAGARRFLAARAPRSFRFTNERDFVRTGQGNPYFVYCGTLASFRLGGRAWESWNESLKRALLPAQRTDGAWAPIDVYARYAGDGPEDAAYTTALCVLSLEVYYRYFLPLLKTH